MDDAKLNQELERVYGSSDRRNVTLVEIREELNVLDEVLLEADNSKFGVSQLPHHLTVSDYREDQRDLGLR
ncbi:hypothetical protein AGR9A_Cc70245 [Agrobacterium salinitolerans str. Hayward 0363]|nr:hypothetical protein AGR9A_Cc70245 [Agrobacterium salinitolerans str. Hayward 0363]